MYIIGIAGGTGSGKTTVAQQIIHAFSSTQVALISIDSYYCSTSHLTPQERMQINFDHPDAIDWPLLATHLQQLRQGQAIEMPTYSFVQSNRLPHTVHVAPCAMLVVEGIMALWRPELRSQMDLKIYVDTDADERLVRVLQRDTAQRGRSWQEVTSRYLQVLKPMHQRYVEPTRSYADLIIPQGGDNERAIALMQAYIVQRLAAPGPQ